MASLGLICLFCSPISSASPASLTRHSAQTNSGTRTDLTKDALDHAKMHHLKDQAQRNGTTSDEDSSNWEDLSWIPRNSGSLPVPDATDDTFQFSLERKLEYKKIGLERPKVAGGSVN